MRRHVAETEVRSKMCFLGTHHMTVDMVFMEREMQALRTVSHVHGVDIACDSSRCLDVVGSGTGTGGFGIDLG